MVYMGFICCTCIFETKTDEESIPLVHLANLFLVGLAPRQLESVAVRAAAVSIPSGSFQRAMLSDEMMKRESRPRDGGSAVILKVLLSHPGLQTEVTI